MREEGGEKKGEGREGSEGEMEWREGTKERVGEGSKV